jgi:glycosyltransferase involved in cell wall biosynthesis
MRITFITPRPDLSGGIRVISTHARNLQARGHEVRIAHPGTCWPALTQGLRGFWRQTRSLARNTRAPTHFDDLQVERISWDPRRPPLEHELPDGDVIVATWWETAEWVSRLSARKGAKAYFVQGHEVFDYLPTERVRATYRLPLHVITISNWLQRVLRDEYRVLDTSLAPNGVDLGRFSSVRRDKSISPVIGMVYSAERLKGSDVCLRAVEIARRRLPNLRLIAFGSTNRAPTTWPVPSQYVCCPAQENIPALYAGCDAWLFGSRSEGFGLPILEAMGCRTPVIAARAGAAPELLADGGGLLVDTEDAEAMAAAIVKICSLSPHEWRQLSDLALMTAQRHTWEAATGHFEAGLERAMRRQAVAHLPIGPFASLCGAGLR